MNTITDFLYDTSFIKEAISYLQAAHNITAVVVDSAGQPLLFDNNEFNALPVCTDFPFNSTHKAGALRCMATKQEVIDQATPHIHMCVKAIESLLLREIELQETTNEMLQLSKELSFLFNISKKLIGINKLQQCCKVILLEIFKAIKADHAFFQTSNRRDAKLDVSFKLASAKVSRIQQLPVFKDAVKDKTTITSLPDGSSALISPIKEKAGPLGHMVFLRAKGKPFFTAYEKKFVGIIEEIISPSIETLRLYDSMRELYLNTVKALAAAIDAKDEYTHGHSFRVAKYSVAIGSKLQFNDENLADLEIAAYMHDLGKIGIPESILGKPAKLDQAEFNQIKKHPVFTNKILQPIHLPDMIVSAAIHHHERLNGSGYPFGLQGKEISLFARIIAVADVFDAATSERPYRKAKSVEVVLRELCEGVNKEYDQEVVLALISTLMEEETAAQVIDIYPNLKFHDINTLNQFLLGLLDFIHPEKHHNIAG